MAQFIVVQQENRRLSHALQIEREARERQEDAMRFLWDAVGVPFSAVRFCVF